MPVGRLTSWVLGHRLVVTLVWVAVALAGGALAPTTADRLTFDFALPGAPAYETNTEILDRLGSGGTNDPLVAVIRGEDAGPTADGVAASIRRGVPGSRVASAADPGGAPLTAPDGMTSLVVVHPPVVPGPEPFAASRPRVEAVVDRAAESAGKGTSVEVTGFVELTESGGGGEDRGVLVEVLLGGAGALVVLVLVFGSLLAGLPLLVAAVSILGTFLALLGLTTLTDVSFVVQFLVGLIGLGVAIDYSLLLVTRWREERDRGLVGDDAVRAAVSTAGHSVLVSGLTVAVSLAALVLVPIPFLRSIGLGGLLIPLLSVATSLTLVPALLSAVGPRLLWPRRRPAPATSRMWTAVSRAVLRHRWLTVVGTSALLLALAAPVTTLVLGSPRLDSLTGQQPAARALASAVEDGVPAGAVRPVEVVVPATGSAQVVDALRRTGGVATVLSPTGQAWGDGDVRVVDVVLEDDPASADGRAALGLVGATAATSGARVGGSAAEEVAFVDAIYGDAPWVVLAVVVATFVLLARALRSLWLPVKALVLDVVSIAAAYGATVLVWQHGWGTELLFGQQPAGSITPWVPIAAFAFLFGLSMDYEVFILSRMREAYDEQGDTDQAVVDGIAHTGRLVSSAALILFLAFVALSTVPTVEVKILATTLALGIAIDALVVRGLLAPALVAVLGPLNWTLPSPLARVLRVHDRQDLSSGDDYHPRHAEG